ncbi:MAG: neprosin family prolyl endopeptidase [Nocardioidaceae bacterium]
MTRARARWLLSLVVATTLVATASVALAVSPAGPRSARLTAQAARSIDVTRLPPAPWMGSRSAQAASGGRYLYAETDQTFVAGQRPRAIAASFTVHHPRQVPIGSTRNDHSLVEMAVRAPNQHFSYIEAGWIVNGGNHAPQLFVFWWRNGQPHCYNFGCGFHRAGTGIRPGATLHTGSVIRLGWVHARHAWWLRVNGRISGYYPDRKWNGTFTRAGSVQIFGEVATNRGIRVCDDMGNGRFARSPRAAQVFQVAYTGGPPVRLRRGNVNAPRLYTLRRNSHHSFRYGGPGQC